MLLETKTNKQRPAASNTRQDFKEFADEFDDQHCRHSRSNCMAFLGVFHYYLSMLALQENKWLHFGRRFEFIDILQRKSLWKSLHILFGPYRFNESNIQPLEDCCHELNNGHRWISQRQFHVEENQCRPFHLIILHLQHHRCSLAWTWQSRFVVVNSQYKVRQKEEEILIFQIDFFKANWEFPLK